MIVDNQYFEQIVTYSHFDAHRFELKDFAKIRKENFITKTSIVEYYDVINSFVSFTGSSKYFCSHENCDQYCYISFKTYEDPVYKEFEKCKSRHCESRFCEKHKLTKCDDCNKKHCDDCKEICEIYSKEKLKTN